MPKQVISFSDFLNLAEASYEAPINTLHNYLQENDCIWKIREAASGYVVSYIHKPTKRTVANFLFRKKVLMLRVYADNILSYEDKVLNWPSSMKDIIRQGGNCSRLSDPNACNSRCLKGFDFMLEGERQQKCRCHMAFTFPLEEETNPHLLEIMQDEIKARQ